MTKTTIWPVILSGGSGSRLWPLSRSLYPKQLLALNGTATMIQQTVKRCENDKMFHPPLIIANEEHRFIIAEQMRAMGMTPSALLLEPVGRNTAPAIALAALYLLEKDEDALMLIMPSDHIIGDEPAFLDAVRKASGAAVQGYLMTFGVVPTHPATGYGYIKAGEAIDDTCQRVSAFIEKPDPATAQSYLARGDFYWNSGIFLMSAKSYWQALKALEPDMAAACERAMATPIPDLDFLRPEKDAFLSSPSKSIDYAVMEKTAQAGVIPVHMGWNDIGSWDAIWELAEKDEHKNAIVGDVFCHEAKGNYLRSDYGSIAAVGIENLAVIATKDAVLVMPRDRAQDVKYIVDQLKGEGRREHELHTRVFRPWGSYETMDEGPRFQTKRLVVKPGEQLSLQKHHHRAEHWIVVEGTAKVTIDDQVRIISENESCYIPLGAKHRLENPGKIPLHIIEVQSGSYLGEDDIVRFDDQYGRTKT